MAGAKPAWAHDARTGPVREYLDQAIFACEGMLVVIDHRPTAKQEGECVVLDCATAEERAKELQKDYRGQTRAQQPRGLQNLWTRRVQGCQNIMECVKEAKAMGDPTDPKVQEFWRRHKTFRIAGYAKAGTRQSREDIIQRVADKSVTSTLKNSDGSTTKVAAIPKKLILPASARPVPEYTPPIPRRKATKK